MCHPHFHIHDILASYVALLFLLSSTGHRTTQYDVCVGGEFSVVMPVIVSVCKAAGGLDGIANEGKEAITAVFQIKRVTQRRRWCKLEIRIIFVSFSFEKMYLKKPFFCLEVLLRTLSHLDFHFSGFCFEKEPTETAKKNSPRALQRDEEEKDVEEQDQVKWSF